MLAHDAVDYYTFDSYYVDGFSDFDFDTFDYAEFDKMFDDMSYAELEDFDFDFDSSMFTEEEMAEFEALFGPDEFSSLFGDDAYSYYVSYESSSDESAGGVVTGSVFLFLVNGGIAYCCYRKKQKEQ